MYFLNLYTRIVIGVFVALVSVFCFTTVTLAAEPSHGLSIFGPGTLKYGPDEPFEYLNPDAPIGGRLRMPGPYFTKLSNFGVTGRAAPLLGVYEPLGIKSWDDDEPFSVYGLLAESFELADDKMSMIVRLRPGAKFADGQPVTADDVVFSYEVMFDPNVSPAFKLRYKDIATCTKIDERTIQFEFKRYARDLPISVAYLTIYPKHIYGIPGKNLGEDFNETLPIGSGPYEVESYALGQSIVLRRRDDYWGKDVPYVKGYLNWKWMEYQVYYDKFSQIEALKSGMLDYLAGVEPITFENMDGDFVEKGYIVKEHFPISRPSAMQCIAFNLRRPMFQDRRLRQVIISLYDFDFINNNFHYGTHDRLASYFHRQPHIRADQGPAQGRVREILLDLANKHNDTSEDRIYVPKEALTVGPYDPGYDAAGNKIPISVRIGAANRELDRMGWKWDPEIGARRRGDQVLQFEILDTIDPGVYHFAETLKQAGIKAKPAKLAPLEVQNRHRNFRFDITHRWYDGRYAPGHELAKHFLSEQADKLGSKNLMGLKNPAIDELLEILMRSENYDEMGHYARAFDRIMMSQAYVIPKNWPRVDTGVYWNTMGRPEKYCSGLWLTYNIMWFWWHDAERAERLEQAMEQGVPFGD